MTHPPGSPNLTRKETTSRTVKVGYKVPNPVIWGGSWLGADLADLRTFVDAASDFPGDTRVTIAYSADGDSEIHLVVELTTEVGQ